MNRLRPIMLVAYALSIENYLTFLIQKMIYKYDELIKLYDIDD